MYYVYHNMYYILYNVYDIPYVLYTYILHNQHNNIQNEKYVLSHVYIGWGSILKFSLIVFVAMLSNP